MDIDPQLDDKAIHIGNLIHELGKFQDQKFEELWTECKENGWIKGVDEDVAREYLFDYCFNGQSDEMKEYDECFTEYVNYLSDFGTSI